MPKLYETANEAAFLRQLGKFSITHGLGREALLKKYKAALPKRANWEHLDAAIIAATVEEMLEELSETV